MMGSRFAETVPAQESQWFVDEMPVHSVSITQPFWLATTETTIAEFSNFVMETGYITTAERAGESLGAYELTTDATGKQSGQWAMGAGLSWKNPGWECSGQHPVVHVSWVDASEFVAWLRAKTGRSFRLPTEAEWEYAAGGPQHSIFSWGNDTPLTGEEGNIADHSFITAYPDWKYPTLDSVDDGSVLTSAVGAYRPNGYGLYDMTGNVWEWCSDYYAPDAYLTCCSVDPRGPETGQLRVHRGGGFDWELPYLRVAKRRKGAEQMSAVNIGFRLALENTKG